MRHFERAVLGAESEVSRHASGLSLDDIIVDGIADLIIGGERVRILRAQIQARNGLGHVLAALGIALEDPDLCGRKGDGVAVLNRCVRSAHLNGELLHVYLARLDGGKSIVKVTGLIRVEHEIVIILARVDIARAVANRGRDRGHERLILLVPVLEDDHAHNIVVAHNIDDGDSLGVIGVELPRRDLYLIRIDRPSEGSGDRDFPAGRGFGVNGVDLDGHGHGISSRVSHLRRVIYAAVEDRVDDLGQGSVDRISAEVGAGDRHARARDSQTGDVGEYLLVKARDHAVRTDGERLFGVARHRIKLTLDVILVAEGHAFLREHGAQRDTIDINVINVLLDAVIVGIVARGQLESERRAVFAAAIGDGLDRLVVIQADEVGGDSHVFGDVRAVRVDDGIFHLPFIISRAELGGVEEERRVDLSREDLVRSNDDLQAVRGDGIVAGGRARSVNEGNGYVVSSRVHDGLHGYAVLLRGEHGVDRVADDGAREIVIGNVSLLIVSDVLVVENKVEGLRIDLISYRLARRLEVARIAVISIGHGISSHVAQRGDGRAVLLVSDRDREPIRPTFGQRGNVRAVNGSDGEVYFGNDRAVISDGLVACVDDDPELLYHKSVRQRSGRGVIVELLRQIDGHVIVGGVLRLDGRVVKEEDEFFLQASQLFLQALDVGRDRDVLQVEIPLGAVINERQLVERERDGRPADDEGRPFVAVLVAHAEDIIVGGKSFGRCAGIISPRVERIDLILPFGIGIGGEENVVHRVATGAVAQRERLKVVRFRLICVSQISIVGKVDISVALFHLEERIVIIDLIVVHAVHRAGRIDRRGHGAHIICARAEAHVIGIFGARFGEIIFYLEIAARIAARPAREDGRAHGRSDRVAVNKAVHGGERRGERARGHGEFSPDDDIAHDIVL